MSPFDSVEGVFISSTFSDKHQLGVVDMTSVGVQGISKRLSSSPDGVISVSDELVRLNVLAMHSSSVGEGGYTAGLRFESKLMKESLRMKGLCRNVARLKRLILRANDFMTGTVSIKENVFTPVFKVSFSRRDCSDCIRGNYGDD